MIKAIQPQISEQDINSMLIDTGRFRGIGVFGVAPYWRGTLMDFFFPENRPLISVQAIDKPLMLSAGDLLAPFAIVEA